MIQNYFDNVKRILGSLISNARVWAGWDKGIYLNSGGSPAKRAKAGGQKGKGFRGRNFCPRAEAKPRRPALRVRKPKQKNFLFLLEEKNRRTQNKKCRENFSAKFERNHKYT